MRIRPSLVYVGIVCWLGLASVACAQTNILFILCDDLGWGDLGRFYQNQRAVTGDRTEPWHFTPHLDTFADEGTQMRQHYCPAPVCAPSRASLLLGVHQGHANVRDNQFDKALEDNHTLATVLKQAGYATTLIGKYGLQGGGGSPAAWPAYPTKRGFDYFYGYVRHGDGHSHYPFHTTYTPGTTNQVRPPKEVWENDTEVSGQLENCYTADLWTARAKRWIMDHVATNASQPFFMYLAYDTPHAALQVPTMAYPAGFGTNGGLQWIGTPGHMINTATGPIDDWIHPDYTNATWDADNNPGTAEVAWPLVDKRFATMVRRLDDAVHDIKVTLQQLGIDQNTLIVFTSDNGPHQEDYFSAPVTGYEPSFFNNFGPFDGIKRDVWEGGVRMATLVRWPGIVPAGETNQTPSQFHDWLPTFATIAGLPSPARSDGVSLLPMLTGAGIQRPPLTYIEYFNNGSTPSYTDFDPSHRGRNRQQMQAIHHAGYKGVRYNIASHASNFEIYDLASDPQETNNLAASLPAMQQAMKDQVLRVRMPDSAAARPYDNEYVPGVTVSPVTTGVEWKAYEKVFPWVPELQVETAVASGLTNRPTVSVRTRDHDIGLLFTGYLNVPADDDYTFHLSADTGALLRIHEATVVDADYGYAGGERSGTIKLKAGLHPFRLYYARRTSGAPSLQLQWSTPSLAKQPVPDTAFLREGAAPPGPPAALDDAAQTTRDVPILIDVLSNDFDDGTPQPLSIQSVTTPLAGAALIVSNQVRYTPNPGFLGTDRFTYVVTDGADTASATVTVDVLYYDPAEVWFPFNHLSGYAVAESGGAMLGTLAGFDDPTNHWVTGRFNRGLLLDGVNDHVVLGGGYLPPSGTAARSTVAWIKTTGTGSIMAWGPNTTSRKWMMRVESAVNFTGALRLEVGGGSVVGTRDLRDDQWHHVAAVLPSLASPNATNVILYVDGVLEPLSSRAASPITTDPVAVTIGTDAQNRYLPGVIDEVRIFSRALSAGEIAALAAATNQTGAAWHRRFFGEATIDWYADDDVDRGVRLLEYALGAEPLIADTPRMKIASEIAGNHLRVSFPRRLAGTHELSYLVQTSLNLADWATIGITELATEPEPMAGFERAVYQTDASVFEVSPLFIRLRVGWQ